MLTCIIIADMRRKHDNDVLPGKSACRWPAVDLLLLLSFVLLVLAGVENESIWHMIRLNIGLEVQPKYSTSQNSDVLPAVHKFMRGQNAEIPEAAVIYAHSLASIVPMV